MIVFLFFEVMDKEPSIMALWVIFGNTVLTWAYLTEFHDPMINPHIWREEPAYLPQIYFMAGAALVFPLVGALLRLRKLNRPN